ncbi:MAG: hypothetical protein HOP12_04380 [Candidatus Eisenbacteria bacterium]|uniref:ADP,ATP carrier protein n=1 Tax=Eiseniibacteriota bacterium TaxID=2212470 RepID=A0A849SPS3_UNCEI|nr:hypothetical protein [Candidatus Eisenbacteria bacterium]
MIAVIARHLKLEPDEARRAISLAVVLGAFTASYTLTKTARDALFLAQLPVTVLPYVYLAIGVLALVTTQLHARLTRRFSAPGSLVAIGLVSAASLGVFAAVVPLRVSWLPIALYMWVNLYGIVLMAQFWIFANSISHTREAKRTFGIVGLGGIVGGLVGGALAAPLAQMTALASLLATAGILIALATPLVLATRCHAAVEAPLPTDAGPETLPLQHPYVRWLALAALCSVVVGGVVDYQFKVELQQRFDDPQQIATFLGQFYMFANLAAIGLQLFLTRWLIERAGAGWSATLLPFGLVAGATGVLFAPGVFSSTLTRAWDHIARMSVNRSATELFYFPLEPGMRRRAKALIDAGLERLGDAFAGLLILAVTFAAGGGLRVMAIAILAVGVVWVIAWLGVRSGYVRELGRNLRRNNLELRREPVSLREATLLAEMTNLLSHPLGRVVTQAIELLLETAPESIEAYLGGLLEHDSPEVRARALSLVRERRLATWSGRVSALMTDPDGEVRVQALAAHCALEGGDPFEPMEPFLESLDPQLRRAAVNCLAEFAPAPFEARLTERLTRVLREGVRSDRIAVAEALGRHPGPSAVHELLGQLLRDDDREVRRTALVSAGRVGRRVDVPLLIEALATREFREAAHRGLIAMGERVVGTLGDYLTDSSVSLELRQIIPRVLGDIPTQESVNAMFRVREPEDTRLDYRLLKAENRLRAAKAPVQFPRALVTEDIQRDVRQFLFALAHYRVCPIGVGRDAERLLAIVLNERMEQALNRVFRRLALIYPAQNALAAYHGILSEQSRARGDALEYLENALAPEHRALVLPLVDDSGDAGRLALARTRYGFAIDSFEQSLKQILELGDPWLKAVALHVVGKRQHRDLLGDVERNLSALDTRVRETATWAQLALLGG